MRYILHFSIQIHPEFICQITGNCCILHFLLLPLSRDFQVGAAKTAPNKHAVLSLFRKLVRIKFYNYNVINSKCIMSHQHYDNDHDDHLHDHHDHHLHRHHHQYPPPPPPPPPHHHHHHNHHHHHHHHLLILYSACLDFYCRSCSPDTKEEHKPYQRLPISYWLLQVYNET